MVQKSPVSYISISADVADAPILSPRHRYRDSPTTSSPIIASEEPKDYHDDEDYMPKRKTYAQKLREQWPTRRTSVPSVEDALPKWQQQKQRRRRPLLWAIVIVTLLSLLGLGLSCARSSIRWRKLLAQQTNWSGQSASFFSGLKGTTPSRPKDATNYALDFDSIYPPLSSSPDPRCQAAWNKLNAVPCHERIWDRSWDNGTVDSTSVLHSVERFVPEICEERCTKALDEAFKSVKKACSRGDVFITEGYDGRFDVEQLEAGPIAALSTLVQRHRHTCRTSKDAPQDYCLVDLATRWGILDGMNAGNLAGIDAFLTATDIVKTEKAHGKSGMRGSGSRIGGSRQNVNYWFPERTYGPARGETTCGKCTLDFFDRKLRSWRKNSVFNAEGQAVSLPDYIRTVRTAARRCERKWDALYDAAIDEYESKGMLTANWDSKTSGDLPFLLANGASEGDAPLPQLRHAMTHATPDGAKCLEALHDHIQSISCYYTVGQLTASTEIIPFPSRLADYCSESCVALRKGSATAKWRDACKNVADPLATETVRAYEDSLGVHAQVCRASENRGDSTIPCAASLQSIGGVEWVFEGRPSSPVFTKAVSKALDSFEKTPEPTGLKTWMSSSKLEPDDRAAFEVYRRELAQGVCSQCVWTWLVGGEGQKGDWAMRTWLDQAKDAEEYLDLVKRFANTCQARGVPWVNEDAIEAVKVAVFGEE